jgi:toxin ParE1/3/4
MSPHERRLILSPRAQDDLSDILQYTLATWGEAQVLAYRAVLDEALRTIQRNPAIGQRVPELSPAHRLFPAGRHLIIYRTDAEEEVAVARILHARMDLQRHGRLG